MALTMQWVKQEHERGCGVAAVAMLTGKTYTEVHKAFPHVNDAEGSRLREYDVYLALEGYAVGRRFSYRDNVKVEEWPPLPFADVHMAEVRVAEGSPCAHVVVMLRDGSVLDPLTPEPKRLTDYFDVYNVAAIIKWL